MIKVWVDICNPPQAVFLCNLMHYLRDRIKCKFLVTCREYYRTKEIIEYYGFKAISVGAHGKSLKEKLVESARRIEALAGIVDDFSPDIAVAKHSVEFCRVCFGLGIKNVFLFDHDPAIAQARLTLPIAEITVAPDAIAKKYFSELGCRDLRLFNGFFEMGHFYYKGKGKVIESEKKAVLIRSEPFFACHNTTKSFTYELARKLKKKKNVEVFVIPRNEEDKKAYEEIGVSIVEDVVNLHESYKNIDVVISAGSTMNREAVVAGCNVLSICQDVLPSIDKKLIRLGLMEHAKSLSSAVRKVRRMLEGKSRRGRFVFSENPLEVVKSLLIGPAGRI